jgi:TonB-dependent receptor
MAIQKHLILAAASLLALSTAAKAAGVDAAESPAAATAVSDLVVTAPREETQARARQQNAQNLIDVQSAETIAKYPDFNAAEALGRIPGISLSSDTGEGRFVNIRGIDANLNGATYGGVVLLNTNAGGTAAGGGGRAVEFDTIPTGAIDGIVVTKTRLPEQEGEGLGGTVELTPRSAAHIADPFLEGTLGWGYEPLHKHTGPADVELAGGARFGFGDHGLAIAGDGQPEPVAAGWISNPYPFAFVLNASRKDDRRAVDDLEESYIDASTPPTDKTAHQYDLRRYDYHRRRFGYGGEFDFQPNDDHTFYVRASIAGYIEAVHKNFLLLRNMDHGTNATGTVVPDPSNPNGFLTATTPTITLTDEQETHRNQVYAIGGKDRFGDLALDYRASYSRATFAVGYNYGATFAGPSGTPLAYDNVTDATFPKFTFVTDSTHATPFNPNDATQYKLTNINNSSEFDVDEEYAYAVNAQTPVHLINDSDRLKVGLEARLRDKTVDPIVFSGITAPSILLSTASGPANTYYDGHYTNGPFINRYAIRSIYNAETTITSATDPNGFFRAKENIYAAYGQYTTDIDAWSFLAGARVEKTQGTYTAFVSRDSGAPVLTSRSADYTDVFPTAQVKYTFSPELIARAIYSTGIARPGFEQNKATASINTTNDPGTVLISRGNPALKPTTGNNFDLSLEYYMPNGGIVEVGLFDKEFQNYIVPRVQHGTTTDPLAPGQLANVTTFLNTSSAYARGAEFAYNQKFTFLPEPFDGFGAEANLTLVDSRILEYDAATSGSGTNQFGLLPGTSKVTWNLAGFYEAHGVQARLSAEYVSHSLFGLGGDKSLDVLQDKRLTMDFTSSYKINPRLTVYFNAKNLLNTPLRYYEGSPDRPIQREFYDVTYEAGVRFKL